MNTRSLRSLALAMAMALLFSSAVFAQGSGTSLAGRVVDDQGAAIPGVTVTATNADTGFQRVTVTESDGSYRFLSLPIGTYSVVAELAGFATVTTQNVVLNVATERNVNIALKQATVSESITVTADAPLVATTAAVGTVVSQDELENLPLNGRQFANLASLAPGTQLSVNSDPTKPGQLTVALNGGSGRNVNYVIDGGDNTDDTIGGALQNFNLEAVEEFKIQTMQYKAEYGRSSGGVLSVVTKSGTNEFAGSAYGFFRDDKLNEATETEKLSGAGKQPYSRKQYGASFGGPIVKDKVHFFATYEKTDRDTAYTVDTSGIFPAFDGQSFAVPFSDELGTAKVSWDATAKQLVQVRYGYQKNTDKYGAASIYLPSNLGTVANNYKSILGSHTWQLGSDKLNEFIYQWTSFKNTISADSLDPNLYFPSGVQVGQNINTPQSTNQEKSQFKDDFSWSFGSRQNFKAGVNYIHEPILGGDFTSGTAGQFAMLDDSANSPVGAITVFGGGFAGDQTPIEQYNFYLQDDWAVNDKLTLNAGIRYDLWHGFDLDQRTNPLLPLYEAAAASHPEVAWLQHFANGKARVLDEDTNNWGPRLGLTYDIAGNGRNIVRAGWGIYYDFPYTNATILFPALSVQSANYGIIYTYADPNGIRNADGTFFRPGIDPLPPNQGAAQIFPREIATNTFESPESTQTSLGYSWQASDWLGLTFDLVNVKYDKIPYRFRANPNVDTDGNGTPDAPLLAGISPRTRVWVGTGSAEYKGANIGFHARINNRVEAQGFYTYSTTDGNVLAGADEFRLWNPAVEPGVTRDVSVNPYDPNCSACFGPLFTDAKHRITVSTSYRAPFGINVAGILRYRSALPYTEYAGSDLNGDGYDMDLAPGVGHVNNLRGDSNSQVDVRIGKEFTFAGNYGIEVIGEIFNLFNSKNATGVIGNRSSANFGQATAYAGDTGQGEQRLGQLGVRVRF